MARRRGFFAELQHQQQLAAKKQAQQQRLAVRQYNQAALARQRAASAHRRAADAARRSTAAEQARLNKQMAAAYVAECEAEAAEKTAGALALQQEIEELLAATLEVDDWVDLTRLRQVFEPTRLEVGTLSTETPVPTYIPIPPRPHFYAPEQPTGLSAKLGGQRKYEAQLADAHAQYASNVAYWHGQLNDLFTRNGAARQTWLATEFDRLTRLEQAQRDHEAANRRQREEVQRANSELDQLITDLRTGNGRALEQYVGIVLANSTYPEAFQVEYDYEFNSGDHELAVTVLVPPPDQFPSVKAVRYVKAKDEFTTTRLSAAELKRRYNNAVHQTALRTPHEVFEADRQGIIDAISLTVAVDTADPATGHDRRVLLGQLAVDRQSFLVIDLSRIEPIETLKHLAAAVSKNPYGLIPLAGQGVRG
jgi:restriction system protein